MNHYASSSDLQARNFGLASWSMQEKFELGLERNITTGDP